MSKEKKKHIIKISVISLIIFLFIIAIYSYTIINKEVKYEYEQEILTYLNETYVNEDLRSYSPVYGLLNYNFDDIDGSGFSTEVLMFSNILINNEMTSEEMNSIYKSKVGMSKNEYINKSNYISIPSSNCYYYENVLNLSGYNCKSVCSKSDSEIIKILYEKHEWDNILSEDIDTYCIKNPAFPIESGGIFINLLKVKEMFYNITGKDLTFKSEITDNEYYGYNSYLLEENLRLNDNIKEISEITNINKSKDIFKVDYIALTDEDKQLNGKVSLRKHEEGYYIISNEINTTNRIN